MRLFLAVAFVVLAASSAQAQSCFRDCMSGEITAESDDIAVKDVARECKETCEARTKAAMETAGTSAAVKDCRGEALSFEDFKKVRAASPSFYVQSNVFVWEAKNPFSDRVITRIDVGAQNLDLNDVGFTGVGLVPPGGTGVFVIPGFYDGYPGARLAGKVQKVYACPLK
ncbi:MAG: hypothetical protein ABW275_03205 [Hansschlegelia sp.]